MGFINVNGRILREGEAAVAADDRSYRYGYGLFETMKLFEGSIVLAELHFDRLFYGLGLFQAVIPNSFTPESLSTQILELCKMNDCEQSARVRLSLSAGRGGLYDRDNSLNYIIESWSLDETKNLGLTLDIFPDARKTCDIFSNLKSSSHLPYALGAQFAMKNKIDDCLVLNVNGRVCDSTIANLFWIKQELIFTPPLTEGCIAGVLRKDLCRWLVAEGRPLIEKPCEIDDLLTADEIFLTNAIRGIRWVRKFRERNYPNGLTNDIQGRYQL